MNSSNNWLLFILILIIIVILVWALLRNRPKQSDLPAHHEPEKTAPTSLETKEIMSEPAVNEPISETATVGLLDSKANEIEVEVETADDLEIIEGIGPKIAKLLNEAGISTFTQLAAADIPGLRKILLAANFRVNDPTSWPEQAKLAAAGKLDELRQFQDQLKAGRA